MNINILADNIKTVEFENVEIYRTIPHNNLNENLNIALNQIKNQIGVLFFSPSGFRAVSNLMSKQLLNQLLVSINMISYPLFIKYLIEFTKLKVFYFIRDSLV